MNYVSGNCYAFWPGPRPAGRLAGTCKCSTFAVSSVRSRRARPPHVGKGSDTRTEPCQERIRRWEQNESRPARLPEPDPNSAKEAENAENGQGAGFALDGF